MRVPIFRRVFLFDDCYPDLIEEGQNWFNITERRGLFEHDALWNLLLLVLSVGRGNRSLVGQIALVSHEE